MGGHNWKAALPKVLWQLRTRLSNPRGFSPFEIFMARKPTLSMKLLFDGKRPETQQELSNKHYRKYVRHREQAMQFMVNNNIQKALRRRAAVAIDQLQQYEKGDLVMLYTPKTVGNVSRKFQKAMWTGPWRVHEKINPIVYKLEPNPLWQKNAHFFQTVPHDRLRIYNPESIAIEPPTPNKDPLFGIEPPKNTYLSTGFGNEYCEQVDFDGDDEELFEEIPEVATEVPWEPIIEAPRKNFSAYQDTDHPVDLVAENNVARLNPNPHLRHQQEMLDEKQLPVKSRLRKLLQSTGETLKRYDDPYVITPSSITTRSQRKKWLKEKDGLDRDLDKINIIRDGACEVPMPYKPKNRPKERDLTYKDVMGMKNEAAAAADLYDKDQSLRFLAKVNAGLTAIDAVNDQKLVEASDSTIKPTKSMVTSTIHALMEWSYDNEILSIQEIQTVNHFFFTYHNLNLRILKFLKNENHFLKIRRGRV